MKIKLVSSVVVAAMIACTGLAHADITMRSSVLNVCPNLSGNWIGQGNLSNWAVKCRYHGTGSVSRLDAAGRFSMSINMDKDSGPLVCPKHVSPQLSGSCNNNQIVINTNFGNIQGNVNATSGTARGRVSVSPGLDADVSIQIRKVG